MRAVLQRVARASVEVDASVVGAIGPGWLVLLGVASGDALADADALAARVVALRGFGDDDGKMNRDVLQAGGSVLVVSQFTLMADLKGGRRPSFTGAAPPADAERLYLRFVEAVRSLGPTVATGVFRADMKVDLRNDGPVTFLLDTRSPA